MERKQKSVPVMLNRAQLAGELRVPLRRVYDAFEGCAILPDAIDLRGCPLLRATRLEAARRVLHKPEIIAQYETI